MVIAGGHLVIIIRTTKAGPTTTLLIDRLWPAQNTPFPKLWSGTVSNTHDMTEKERKNVQLHSCVLTLAFMFDGWHLQVPLLPLRRPFATSGQLDKEAHGLPLLASVRSQTRQGLPPKGNSHPATPQPPPPAIIKPWTTPPHCSGHFQPSLGACPALPRKPQYVSNKAFHTLLVHVVYHQFWYLDPVFDVGLIPLPCWQLEDNWLNKKGVSVTGVCLLLLRLVNWFL